MKHLLLTLTRLCLAGCSPVRDLSPLDAAQRRVIQMEAYGLDDTNPLLPPLPRGIDPGIYLRGTRQNPAPTKI